MEPVLSKVHPTYQSAFKLMDLTANFNEQGSFAQKGKVSSHLDHHPTGCNWLVTLVITICQSASANMSCVCHIYI